MLTIFIPVLNEEAILEQNFYKLKKFLDSKKTKYRIYFGINGSTDKTLQIVKKLQSKFPQLISYDETKLFGIGRAFRKFIENQNFEKVITVDIDLSHDLNFIIKANKLLDEGNDLIIGYKSSKIEKRSIKRKIISFFYRFLVRYFLGIKYKDTACGAKGYSGKFLKGKEKFIDDEIFHVISLIKEGEKEKRKIVEVPVEVNDTRKSKLELTKSCVYMGKRIFKGTFSKSIVCKPH